MERRAPSPVPWRWRLPRFAGLDGRPRRGLDAKSDLREGLGERIGLGEEQRPAGEVGGLSREVGMGEDDGEEGLGHAVSKSAVHDRRSGTAI